MIQNNVAQESWNMATETLKRLSRCLDMVTFYSQIGELPNMFNAVLSLKNNLSCFLEPNEMTDIENELYKLPPKWKTTEGKVLRMQYGKVHMTLTNVYTKCLGYMKAKGLLMPKPSDPRAAVLNN
jgi:hypothetical protein